VSSVFAATSSLFRIRTRVISNSSFLRDHRPVGEMASLKFITYEYESNTLRIHLVRIVKVESKYWLIAGCYFDCFSVLNVASHESRTQGAKL
jgi:hypothetical protein